MNTAKLKRFKGEIENYLNQNHNAFESRIDKLFKELCIKTCLYRSRIYKKDGFHTSHVLFVLVILPILKLKTVHSFCNKYWFQWSQSRKDTFYRFKQNPSFRWRSFLYKVNEQIFKKLKSSAETFFILDDSVFQKCGRQLENVSFIQDHTIGKSVLGYNVLLLGLLRENGFYPLDFAYRFGKKRHPKSRGEVIGSVKSQSETRSYEARHHGKPDLAYQMIKRAIKEQRADYLLFDSWFANPVFFKKVLDLNVNLHIICRLKNTKTKYHHQGKQYTLGELYKKYRFQLKRDNKTGLMLKRVTVELPNIDQPLVIILSKGVQEPTLKDIKGSKTQKKKNWVAFLSTDTSLHASSIIRKYVKRWSIEVCFKECKQLLELGKDQANDFNSQVAATSISFLRYNLLNYLNEIENHQTFGGFFELLHDEMAPISHANRLYDFFTGLIRCIVEKITEMSSPEISSLNTQTLGDIISGQLNTLTVFQGCET